MLSTADILHLRPRKNSVDPWRPVGFFVEPECSAAGSIDQVATILLTGRECVFRCVMCDLWKNTLDEDTPRGAIAAQIDVALSQLPPARVLKLYNSSNFFDPHAVPVDDYPSIAERVRRFDRVIVENHPRLCTDRCKEFAELIAPCRLEVALGVETVHAPSLEMLNKQMTLLDVNRAVKLLLRFNIDVRAFLLLRLPGMDEQQGREWAIRSMQVAFAMGVQACTVIPLRGGNGAMEALAAAGLFAPPSLRSLEIACDEGLKLKAGRVFADLWDIEKLSSCDACQPARLERLRMMNLQQYGGSEVQCAFCNSQ